jgi:hypothetical protein
MSVLLHELLIHGFLHGRDGEGEGSGGPGAEGQEPDPPAQEAAEGEEGKDDSKGLSPEAQAQLSKARREAKSLRDRAKAAEKKLEEIEKAKLSDLEKAQKERDDATKRAEKAEAALQRIAVESVIAEKAEAAGFAEPSDAAAFIDVDSIEIDDEGKIDGRTVKSLVEAVAKEKPHLLKSKVPGSGDGGGKTPAKPKDYETRVDEAEKQLLESKGMVRVPGL